MNVLLGLEQRQFVAKSLAEKNIPAWLHTVTVTVMGYCTHHFQRLETSQILKLELQSKNLYSA
jgi:hypothetical protein